MIPFTYGKVVSGDQFCGREDLVRQLTRFIKTPQNVLVQGERRIGKTSLIYETIQRAPDYRPLFVDFMGVKTSHDFCQRIIKAIISLEAKSNLLNRILKQLSSIRPQIGIDPITQLPTITLDPAVRLTPASLEEVFDLILKKKKKRKVVVVFDEFQDILNLTDTEETQAILRSKIQYHDSVPYVFAGSIRKKMDQIFTHPDSPLFKSAIPLTVGPLPQKEFSSFLQQKFALGDRTISEKVIHQIFDITDDICGDIQQLCEALWSVTEDGEQVTDSHLVVGFDLIFSRESKSYELIMAELTHIQQTCLLGLARLGGSAPMSSSFLQGTGISQPSTVKKALEKLLKKRIIFKVDREYRFTNPFFKAWLNYKNF